MKLRNRQTGEIGELIHLVSIDLGNFKQYKTLDGLYKEWEDYEEPKIYWYIDCDGTVMIDDLEPATTKKCMELGNYFGTKEEAEKAVEKLKAWKRLKDAGLKVTEFNYNLDEKYSGLANAIDGKICFKLVCYKDFNGDLDLLFGGGD